MSASLKKLPLVYKWTLEGQFEKREHDRGQGWQQIVSGPCRKIDFLSSVEGFLQNLSFEMAKISSDPKHASEINGGMEFVLLKVQRIDIAFP